MSGSLLVTTTFESRADAEKMANLLLEKRLIACAQITAPVSSIYWWQGQIVASQEYLLVMKSDESQYPELERLIQASHPYDIPEVIATTISHLSEKYRNWLAKELQL